MSATAAGSRPAAEGHLTADRRRTPTAVRERLLAALLLPAGLVSLITTVGIVVSLVTETSRFFALVSIREFLTGTRWTPTFEPARFGILPLLSGTFLITAGSALVAVPMGLACALYLSEYAPDRVRRVLKPVLELLAGVPTVVYGFFALTAVTPLLRRAIPDLDVFNALSAIIAVGIMILPMVASMAEDAMLAVPRSLREAAFALGATRLEVALRVVLPASVSGVVSAVILAVSRAAGETMIVAMAAGATPKLTLNPLESIQTMTGFIAQVAQGDLEVDSAAYTSIYAVGMALFLITLAMNLLAGAVRRRYREREQP